MEGVSHEAASLAGHLQLSNLCWIYDNNKITIEGHTELATSDDVATRFIGYGWNVTRVGDANDLDILTRAFNTFLSTPDRPTLIIVDSHIAYGAPNKQDTSAAHGEPLGEEEIRLTKQRYGWPEDATFLVPDGVRDHFREGLGKRGRALRENWFSLFEAYKQAYPDLADHLDRMQHRQLPDGWDGGLPSFPADAKGLATRDSSGKVLNIVARNVPWFIGGSADLGPSTKTRLTFDGAGDFFCQVLRRTKSALRHSRTCDGRRGEWAVSFKGSGIRVDFSGLLRLRPSAHEAVGPHGNSCHLYLYARFHRLWVRTVRHINPSIRSPPFELSQG